MPSDNPLEGKPNNQESAEIEKLVNSIMKEGELTEFPVGGISDIMYKLISKRHPDILPMISLASVEHNYSVPKSSKVKIEQIFKDPVVAYLNMQVPNDNFEVLRKIFSHLFLAKTSFVDERMADKLYAWYINSTMIRLQSEQRTESADLCKNELQKLRTEEGINPASENELEEVLAQAIDRALNSKAEE